MNDQLPAPTTMLLEPDHLDVLLLGATVSGVVLDEDADSLRVRLDDGRRWELAVHVLDVVRYGRVAGIDRHEDELRLLGADGDDLIAIVDQPTPAASWDLAHWVGGRGDLAGAEDDGASVARTVLEAPDVVVRLGHSRVDGLTGAVVAVRGPRAVLIDERDGVDEIDVVVFDPIDLIGRVLEVGGLLDPYGLEATVDLLITAPSGEGRSRVTVLEWTGDGGRLTTPGEGDLAVEADPGAMIEEITGALAPYATREAVAG